MAIGRRGRFPQPVGNGEPSVLHVVESLSSGVATALEDYVRSTPEYRHVILSHRRQEAQTGDALDQLASASLALPGGHLARMRAIRRQLRWLSPSIVHAHSSLAGLYTRLGAGSWRRLVVYTPHCYAFERTDVPFLLRAGFWLVEAAMSRTGGYVAASSPREAELARRLGRRTSVVYVPCAPRIGPIERPGAGPDRGQGLRVMTVGRLAPQKDPDFFARAARASRATAADTRWIWVGGGRPAYERLLRAAGVEVTGWLTREDSLRWLSTADVYVHTAAWEGAPMSVLEAAALNLPILARRSAALEALGLEPLYDTPEAIVAAMEASLDDRHRERVRACSQRLLERHGADAQRRALEHVYAAAAEAARPAPG